MGVGAGFGNTVMVKLMRSSLWPLGRRNGGLVALRSCSSLSKRLSHELTSRQLPLAYDYLHPQPSHLLNVTLADLFAGLQKQQKQQRSYFQEDGSSTTLPVMGSAPPCMAPGHHLVYFPPQVTLSQLLADGTDVLHTPGNPFNRRLWAGGRVKFPVSGGPLLNGSRAVCLEIIRDVAVKGREGEEKVIVSIERRVGTVEEQESHQSVRERLWTESVEDPGAASVIETRNLIFMREKTREHLDHDIRSFGTNTKNIKPPSEAEFRHSIIPNKALLFRFSALTFNAHLIHLDQSYTRHIEGYRNLLVHGPLTLTLILTALQIHLTQRGLKIKDIDYRNLAPLYVDEELAVCGKQKVGRNTDADTWDVWIEGPEGGLAVRGTVYYMCWLAAMLDEDGYIKLGEKGLGLSVDISNFGSKNVPCAIQLS